VVRAVFMGALVLSTVIRMRREQQGVVSFASMLCGLISAYPIALLGTFR